MNKEQARQLVKETFHARFDEARYLKFVAELTNGNITKPSSANMAVPDAFAEHVKSCKRLGTYTNDQFEQVDIMVVSVKSSFKLQRTRTALRNFVAHKLKRGDGDDNSYKDAGLVAFVSPDASEWRFSLVRMEYQTKRDPNTGKFKAEEQLTPARRYSYLVGPNEQTHTAQSRFIDLLIARGHPTVDDLLSAFSVEKVTNEFFDAYKKLFLTTLGAIKQLVTTDPVLARDFGDKQINLADFTKKMLGQIVFLYFLQKKGWLGVAHGAAWGTGPTNFMRTLLEQAQTRQVSLFNDVLEPLFYDTLAVDRKGDNYWSKALGCRIPFLNGGLFEPINGYDWRGTTLALPNELFANQAQTGILDVFDRYNFTVDEAEPLESDVAIDPEMLGKVFENLLDVDERAEQGAFYTPREIVHYMCQVSLVHYLTRCAQQANLPMTRADIEFLVYKGDQTLEYEQARMEGTKSPVRMPQAITQAAHAKALDKALADMTVLDPAIGSGAFPVGMMSEIVRLRQLLGTYFTSAQSRTVYELKRHTIQQSLYGVDIAPGAVDIAKLRLWLSLVVDEDDVSRIKPLPNLDFKIVVGNSLLGVQKNVFNYDLFNGLQEAKSRFFEETDHDSKQTIKHEIEQIIAQLTNNSDLFDYDIYFHEVMGEPNKGFDIVIGNPPYVQLQKFRGQAVQKLYREAGFASYDANGDLYCLFYEKGLRQLKPGGSLCFITSNKWMRAGYGEVLRRYFLTQNPLLLIDLGPGVFGSATVDSNILQIERTDYQSQLHGLTLQVGDNARQFVDVVTNRAVHLGQICADPWLIGTAAELSLKAKITQIGKPLKEWDVSIYRGVLTGLNEAFVIDTPTRDAIVARDPRSAEIIKPVLRGRDIKRYGHAWAGLWLIQTNFDLDVPTKYPAIYDHLLQFESKARKRSDKGVNWWNLRACVYYSDFEKPKIIYPNMTKYLPFIYDEKGYYTNQKCFIITSPTQPLKYLTGVMNSKLGHNWIRDNCPSLGSDRRELSKIFMENLPIPPITPANQPLVTAIEACVERILEAKQGDLQADTQADEAQIDQLVYQLYALTPDEIALIEAAPPGASAAGADDEDDG